VSFFAKIDIKIFHFYVILSLSKGATQLVEDRNLHTSYLKVFPLVISLRYTQYDNPHVL